MPSPVGFIKSSGGDVDTQFVDAHTYYRTIKLVCDMAGDGNLFDVMSVSDGLYVNENTGNTASNDDFFASDFIPVDPNSGYFLGQKSEDGIAYLTGLIHAAYYDESMTYLSGFSATRTGFYFATPSACSYIRISAQHSGNDIDTLFLTKNLPIKLPLEFGKYVSSDNVLDARRLSKRFALKSFTESPNIVNPDETIPGKFVNYTNGIIESPASNVADNFKVTRMIPVGDHSKVCLKPYIGSGNSQCAFYDKNRKYVSGYIDVTEDGVVILTLNKMFLQMYTFDAPSDFIAYGGYTGAVDEIVVAKDGSGDYTTLTEAVANAYSGDTIFVRSGVYENEVVEAWGKRLTIRGESEYSTVIRNTLNTYSTPPLEMSIGVLEDITIESAGTGESTDPSGWAAYAMHVEHDSLNGASLVCKNVTFSSRDNSALGMGTRGGCKVLFEHCRFVSPSAPVYLHDAANAAQAGRQEVSFVDCVVLSEASNHHAMRIASQKTEGSDVYVEFVRNVVACSDGETPVLNTYDDSSTGGTSTTKGTFHDLTNFYEVPTSVNNSMPSIDYSGGAA